MDIPTIYSINEHGVATDPTKVWEEGNFYVSVATEDGYFWSSGSRGTLSTQGWGFPVTFCLHKTLRTSIEEAALQEAKTVYNRLIRITDGSKKDELKIKNALFELERAFPELHRESTVFNLATLATIL